MSEGYAEGIRLYRTGQYSDALTFFLQYTVTDDDDSMDYLYYVGLSYVRLERYEDAMLYLEQVVTSADVAESRIRQCRLLLAVIYAVTGRARLAEFEIEKLVECGYRPVMVQSVYAYLLWKQHKTAECIAAYEKALEEDAQNATALNGLGYVLACSGKDYTRALSLCKKALVEDPDSAAYLDSLGWVYFHLGLLNEAESYIGRARQQQPACREIGEHYRAVAEKKLAK
ncbi:MAG TPA: tetratricopeptide repeat protein [Candidatus Treponema faecavium]|nr:tetratricopeptide repeat protein [Candidatus Treponema faecavium]